MSRLRDLPDADHLPALDPAYLSNTPALGLGAGDPPPRMLLLYGSLRERSFSRLCVEEAARLLRRMGCEIRIFDPSDLPLTDQVADQFERVAGRPAGGVVIDDNVHWGLNRSKGPVRPEEVGTGPRGLRSNP